MADPKGLAIIIGKLKEQAKKNPYGQKSKLGMFSDKPEDDEDKMSSEESQLEAANDVLKAIDGKDPKAFLEALKDLLVLCDDDEAHYDDEDYIYTDKDEPSSEDEP